MNNKNPIRQGSGVLSLYPNKVFSLLDIMRAIGASTICVLMNIIQIYDIETDKKPPGTLLAKDEAKYIYETFKGYSDYLFEIGWKDASRRLGSLTNVLRFGSATGMTDWTAPTMEAVHTALVELDGAITHEMETRLFLMIEADKSDFFDNERPFGENVFKVFPLAREEIKHAGEYIATNLHTAAVFHLMRIVELGMRDLAFQLKAKTLIVTLKKSAIKITTIPVEFGMWSQILETLEIKMEELQNVKRGPKREKKLEICAAFIKEFRAIKELRDRIMHARSACDEHDAESAFSHVRKLMQRLAENSINRVRL